MQESYKLQIKNTKNISRKLKSSKFQDIFYIECNNIHLDTTKISSENCGL